MLAGHAPPVGDGGGGGGEGGGGVQTVAISTSAQFQNYINERRRRGCKRLLFCQYEIKIEWIKQNYRLQNRFAELTCSGTPLPSGGIDEHSPTVGSHPDGKGYVSYPTSVQLLAVT